MYERMADVHFMPHFLDRSLTLFICSAATAIANLLLRTGQYRIYLNPNYDFKFLTELFNSLYQYEWVKGFRFARVESN